MRPIPATCWILAALIVCALGPPGASAGQGAKSNAVTMTKRSQSAHPATAKRAGGHRRNNGLGGIHPLVGSGDY